MKILHYALGFPPYRTGGLTKYCTDLMLTQVEQGHEVALLWPGKIAIIKKQTEIHKGKNWNEIESFEIINPLPVSLDEGILDVDAYTKNTDETVYYKFLQDYAPDAIHIHTLMGLHKEFIHAANKLGMRTVFTTHDYLGLCPKVTLFHNGKPCDDDHGCMDCVGCNQSALSLKKITVLQSPIYRKLKNTSVVKLLRSRHRKNFFEEAETETAACTENIDAAKSYEKLREYYVSMLKMVDFIHFNSSVTEMIYNRYFHPKNSAVISITHRDIKDHRKRKNFDHDVLRITYLGPAKPFKGFQFLIGVLDKLWQEDHGKFELHIYTNTNVEREYITHMQDGYPYSQLEEIFDNTDLLIVPSQWYETFGFTVLEALSYGVPVMVSDKVGAQDLLCTQYIFDGEKSLKKILQEMEKDKKILALANDSNVKNFMPMQMNRHSTIIKEKLYRKLS